MKKMRLQKAMPIVLSCLSVVGVVATAVLSSKAATKASLLVETAEAEKGEELDKVEVIKAAVPAYVPTVLMGVSTIACIVGSSIFNKKQQVAIAGAYAMLNQYHKEYRSTVKEVCGEEADKKVCSEMLRKRCNYRITDLQDAPDQKVIFYDEISGNSITRYERDIMDAEYHLNRNFVLRGYATLNELYEMLGMPKTEDGEKLGWNMEDGYCWIDFEHRLLSRDEAGMDVYSIDIMCCPSDSDPSDYSY